MFLDLLIAVIILVAVVAGYQKGLIQPLMVEIFFIGTILFILRERRPYAGLMESLHANAVLAVLFALLLAVVAGYAGGVLGGSVNRVPMVRGVDGFLGIFVHVGLAVLLCYFLISALVALDKAFTSTLPLASLNQAQVAGLRKQINSNALTAALVDSRDLDNLQRQAKTPGGARIETVSQINQLATFYVDFVQPQLRTSRLSPMIVGVGKRFPVVGRVGPSDLPKPTPAPRISPAPTPKPSS
jgi:Colicin V production protein